MPIRTFITVIALVMCSLSTAAQTLLPADTTPNKNTSGKKDLHAYNQVAYISALGPGCGVSLNYDIRFNGTLQRSRRPPEWGMGFRF